MATKRKGAKRVLSGILTIVMIAATLLCFTVVLKATFGDNPPDVFGFRFFYVVSGSMEPTIHEGDAIVVSARSEYAVDDIITFESESQAIAGKPNTHRVVEVFYEDGVVSGYRTKGDANSIPDETIVTPSQVYGKVILKLGRLEWIGKFISFLSTRNGFFLVFIIPVLLIAVIAMKDFLKAQKAVVMEKLKAEYEQQQSEQNTEKKEDQQ